jgi:hypothetical protein
MVGLNNLPLQPEDTIALRYECINNSTKTSVCTEVILKLDHNQTLDIVDKLKRQLI